MKPFIAFIIFLLTGWSTYGQSTIALTGGNIIDVATGSVARDMTVLITGDKIEKIGKNGKVDLPENATVISASGKWIMPGMIDGHVHFFQSGGLYTRPDVIDLRSVVPYQQEQVWAIENINDLFARYLKAGITYVCDFGGPMTNYAFRFQAKQSALAPDLFVTGPLISTYQPDAFNIDIPPIIKVNTPEEARKLVQKQLPLKPDYIKIWYIVRRGQTAEDNLDIIKATIDESHKFNIPVAVHATQLKTARLAVEAGADILVHSVDDQPVDEAFIQLLKKNQVSYIPTMIVSHNYEKVLSQHLTISKADFELANPFTLGTLTDLQHLSDDQVPGWASELMKRPLSPDRRLQTKNENLKRMVEAGVNVVAGTDAGNIGTLHASSYYAELAAMQAAGLSSAEILKTATLNGAKMLQLDKQRGSIETGKLADVLVLEQNPLEDISHLNSIEWIVRKGNLIKPDTIVRNTPEMVAQQQLNAYNARDIEAFLACYHPQVKVYNFPNELRYTGIENMRKNYTGFFETTPNLHCELVNRITIGNKVIDRERVTGLKNGSVIHAVAIYTIHEGKITEVYFMRG